MAMGRVLTSIRSWRVRRRLSRMGARLLVRPPEPADVGQVLRDLGAPVRPFRVDVADFEDFVESAGYADLEYYDGGRAPNAREKYLEHYISLRLLDPEPGQVLIDVAAMNSPFADVAARLFGLDTYRQDLAYTPGVRDRTIGSDASSMPIDSGFADHLVAHCSLEHFAGSSDTGFIQEAARVLRPAGKLCVLPLYLSSRCWIQVHAKRWRRVLDSIEPGDSVYLSPSWVPPFSRFYDAHAFRQRITSQAAGLELELHEVVNLEEVCRSCYARYAAVFTSVRADRADAGDVSRPLDEH